MKTRTFKRRNTLNLILIASVIGYVTLPSARGQSTASVAPAGAARIAASSPGRFAGSSAERRTKQESRSNGLNTGIKVHGHWVIEVKSPDGTLVERREFENSLASGNNCCGDRILAGLVGGALTSPSWAVVLLPSSSSGATIDISQANSTAATYCNSFAQQQPGFSCSTNLSVTVPESSNSVITAGTVTFSGSGTVPQNFAATIGFVATAAFPTGNPLGQTPGTFTSRVLDGQNGDPPAVPVVPGQTVAVSVTISFQ